MGISKVWKQSQAFGDKRDVYIKKLEGVSLNRVAGFDDSRKPPKTPYIVVEFGDYQCPPCRKTHYMLKKLLSSRADKVTLIFRHKPLTRIHPFAFDAATAAASAGKQGKFWEMHDLLYANPEGLSKKNFIEYASLIKIDADRFRADLKESARTQVKQDMADADFLGIDSTPTLIWCEPNGQISIVDPNGIELLLP